MSEHERAALPAATDKTATAESLSELRIAQDERKGKNNFRGGGKLAAPDHYFAIDGEHLMGLDLPPIQYVVEELLTPGLYVLAGGPKTGKSWMMLQFSLSIVQGEPVFGYETNGQGVLYMCLEDSYRRIRRRIDQQDAQATKKLHFLNTAPLLRDGLEAVIDRHIRLYPDIKLVIIDTFQMVRGSGEGGSYGGDYADVRELKLLADELGITILLVHHLRKKKDDDPHNMISGTTGLTGAADGSFVLFRDKECPGQFKLSVNGRDIEQKVLTLAFDTDTLLWEMVSCQAGAFLPNAQPPKVLYSLCDFIKTHGSFTGSASELLSAMGDATTPVNTLTKVLNTYKELLLANGILYEHRRTNSKKIIELAYCS